MIETFEDLCLLPGQPLVVEFDSYGSFRDKSLYIGMKRNNSLLITTPIVNGSTVPVQMGQHLSIRLFANQANCACAFHSEVIHIVRKPYGYLHLALPEHIEIGEVRNSTRAKVNLKAQVVFDKSQEDHVEDRQVACEVLDISVNGAKVESKAILGKVGMNVVLLMKLRVQEIIKVIKVNCEIKSLSEGIKPQQRLAGLQFKSLSENDRLMLYAYVYSHLFESL